MHLDDLAAASLEHYEGELLPAVAAKLFRARIGQPADELRERILSTQKNPPVIDRLLKQLPDDSRLLFAAVGRTRQPRWRMDDLLALAVALRSPDSFTSIRTLLEHGLLIAETITPISSFTQWFEMAAGRGTVIVPSAIIPRAAALDWPNGGAEAVSGKKAAAAGDGLDWPLRLAAARQLVRAAPVKLTNAGTLYKRDAIRFTADAVLLAPLENGPVPADAGLLALSWARAAHLLSHDGELSATAWPASWSQSMLTLQTDLFAALFAVRDWDPLLGHREEATATITAGLLILLRLAETPADFQSTVSIAEWLWEQHPHWSGLLPKETAHPGTAWVEAWLAATMVPLAVVELQNGSAKLGALGRHLLANGPTPPEPPAFPKTLLVQPNGELLVYRQGLTPLLLSKLTSFAAWKRIGSACSLELTAEGITRGLEDGVTHAEILQTLDRHGMKPTPPNLLDLIRRWADRREKLIVYSSATLVEFLSSADLDNAIERGIVSVRLTDRIGVTANGKPPDFANLRLIGNRDYEAKPQECVIVEDDGVTLSIDAASSDLLLDAEIAQFAEPLLNGDSSTRKYRLSPETLNAAMSRGHSPELLEEWFRARSGEGLPAAAQLFLAPPLQRSLTARKCLVVETPTAVIAEGIAQWPETAPFVERRLGPSALVVAEDHLADFLLRLSKLGIRIERNGDGA